jgi:serine/threonine protein kinase
MTINLENRILNYYKTSNKLAHFDKKKLDKILKKDSIKKSWGKINILNLDDSKVFIKRIPLTELEYKNLFSTKNLYNLPTFYNYGVGSAGFGAFRELVTHIKTTNWVLSKECENFPLMYHYRIVENNISNIEIDYEKHNKYIERWNNDKNISEYIISRKKSKYEIVLFLEYIPFVISTWLNKNTNKVNSFVEQITKTIDFLIKKEIIHFDIHNGNILTDGDNFYLTDFGLTLDRNFDLSKKEQDFFDKNSHYDYAEFFGALGAKFYSKYESKIGKDKNISNLDDPIDKLGYFLNNFETFNKPYLKKDRYYFDVFYKNKNIILLFNDFYLKIMRNNKKNNILDNDKVKFLLSSI